MTEVEGFLQEKRFELGVEKQLGCGKQKEGIDIAEGENGVNQRGEEDKNMEIAGTKASP